MKNKTNKLILRTTIAIQTLYLVVIFAYDTPIDIYFAFYLSAILNILSLVLNFINICRKGHFKFLFLLTTICEILLTLLIFLLPKAGNLAPIKLF